MKTPLIKRLLLKILGNEFVSYKTYTRSIKSLNQKNALLKNRVRTLEYNIKHLADQFYEFKDITELKLRAQKNRLEHYKKYHITYKYKI